MPPMDGQPEPIDTAASLAALRCRAEAGDHQAAFRLGLAYARGEAGLATDPQAAEHWCRQAAEAGDPYAQYNLGLLHATRTEEGAATTALRWLRLAAVNGLPEAEACLALVEAHPARPRTWDEASTHASVALARSDPEAAKRLRLADYYVDPCLDLLERRYRLERDQAEEVVQEFFLELEEPLSKGVDRGRRWKDVLRERYRSGRGGFRAFFGQALANFMRDWQRRQRRPAGSTAGEAPADPIAQAAALAHEWRPELDRFAASAKRGRASLARAAEAVRLLVAEGLTRREIAERMRRAERSLGRDLRMGSEALHDWLRHELKRLAPEPRIAAGLSAGIALVPDWLSYPSGEKRARLLLLLALLARQRGRPLPPVPA